MFHRSGKKLLSVSYAIHHLRIFISLSTLVITKGGNQANIILEKVTDILV